MKMLQQLLEQAEQKRHFERTIPRLHEAATTHGNILCDLVESYMDSCDPDEVDKASEILDKIGQALDMSNQVTDPAQRIAHVQRINDLLRSVRDIVKNLVDQIKGGHEENEEDDINTFLDQFLSQIEDLVNGEETGVSDMGDDQLGAMDDLDRGTDTSFTSGTPAPGEVEPTHVEDEETIGRTYRSNAHPVRESQRRTFGQYLLESSQFEYSVDATEQRRNQMKYLYVLEDGEIVECVDFDSSMSEVSQVNELCKDHFSEEFSEVSEEKNGTLYLVSDTEMIFVSDIDTRDAEELFR